jgi:hypothetical protein
MNTFDFGIIGLCNGSQPALEYGRPKFAVAGLDLDEKKFFTHTRSESTPN